eukprot:4966414-Lingulodinium_polyedra.AAC.1
MAPPARIHKRGNAQTIFTLVNTSDCKLACVSHGRARVRKYASVRRCLLPQRCARARARSDQAHQPTSQPANQLANASTCASLPFKYVNKHLHALKSTRATA